MAPKTRICPHSDPSHTTCKYYFCQRKKGETLKIYIFHKVLHVYYTNTSLFMKMKTKFVDGGERRSWREGANTIPHPCYATGSPKHENEKWNMQITFFALAHYSGIHPTRRWSMDAETRDGRWGQTEGTETSATKSSLQRILAKDQEKSKHNRTETPKTWKWAAKRHKK